MNRKEQISDLKKLRDSIDYYQNHKESIDESGMQLDDKTVYISVLNDYSKHIEREEETFKDALKLTKSKNNGYVAMQYFLFIVFIIFLVALSYIIIRGGI